jgi:hypothetical protein
MISSIKSLPYPLPYSLSNHTPQLETPIRPRPRPLPTNDRKISHSPRISYKSYSGHIIIHNHPRELHLFHRWAYGGGTCRAQLQLEFRLGIEKWGGGQRFWEEDTRDAVRPRRYVGGVGEDE